ncbi:MAG TPA: GNAT family N-acetyltransferase [Candidatus Dormibacteraeota bacterium]
MSPGAAQPALEIGPPDDDEVDALGDAVVAAYRSVDPVGRAGYLAEVHDVRTRARTPGMTVLAARLDGEPVGCCTVVLAGEDRDHGGELEPDTAVLRMLGVAPAFHGRGVGRALVSAALEVARAAGKSRLELFTEEAMRAAQSLYMSLGFVRVRELDWTVPDGGPRLLGFTRDLGA